MTHNDLGMGRNAAPDGEIEIDLNRLWQLLMQRKWIIIGLFIVAAAGAYMVSDAMTPIYEASTTVLVQDSGSTLDSLVLGSLSSSGASEVQRAVEVFKSRSLALQTAQTLGYDWDDYAAELQQFRDRITVQISSGSDLLRIAVEHEDPVEAQRIANALVASFIERTREMSNTDVRSAREFLAEQITQFEADLQEAEEELVRFQEEMLTAQSQGTGDGFLAGESKALADAIARLEILRSEAIVAREAAEQRLLSLEGDLASQTRSIVTGTVIAGNPLIQGIRSQLVALESELAAAMEQYTERHPRIVGLQAQIHELRAELGREMSRLELTDAEVYFSQEIVSVQAELVAQTARIDALDRMISTREALLSELPEKELHLAQLMRKANVSESIYTTLLTRHEEMRISEAMESAHISILDPAVIPQSPIKPRKRLNVAIAGFLGIFVGVGIAFLLEFAATGFRDTEELEEYLGVPVLGRIPVFEQSERRSDVR